MQFGLIGRQLGHSFSKELHGKIGNYQYDLLELEPEQLAIFFRERIFRGINVTVPYKEKVISFLDMMSDTAQNIGAVNTVVNVKGKLFGDNTDFAGFKSLLCHNKLNVKNKKVLVLGTGGTSKTVTAVLNFFNCD
ncbi:MAG: shikimate dehydrogenase, partial [Acidaminococcaceae bacterium]|nr:shikimate dehydrogenase [Acidaminococcaceae bacterium]